MKLGGRKSETKVQFSCETRWEYLVNEYKRARKHPIKYLKFRYKWKNYPLKKVPEFPLNLDIESSSRCNLLCDHCFRQYMDMGENALMPWEMYTKIIDECAQYDLFTLKFSMRGEPTLNPRLPEMVAYAKEKGIPEVWINTHGGRLKPGFVERFVQAKPDWITVSFDGLGEMYESIRKPLKYEESLQKLKYLRECRDKYSPKTLLNVQALWSAIKHDPEEYMRVMKPIVDRVVYNPDMNFKEIMLVPDDTFVCPRLWQRIAITAEGDFLKCPSDFEKEEVMANISTTSVKQAWDTMQEQNRQLHLSGRKKESSPCQKCHHGAKKVPRVVQITSTDSSEGLNYEFNKEFNGVGLNRETPPPVVNGLVTISKEQEPASGER